MGCNVDEACRMLASSHGRMQLHLSMYKELQIIMDRTLYLIPEIEAARPGFMFGISELCSLNNSIEKARSLIEHCSDSSKLYLAITGETSITRCERIRSSIEKSLTHIQTMVPEPLASQISDSIDSFRDAKFVIDSSDDDAGKVLLALLCCNDATKDYEFKAFRLAAFRLQLTTPRALLVEKRCIQKLLEKNNNAADVKKKGILKYLLYLLKTYGSKIHKENIGLDSNDSLLKRKILDDSTDHSAKICCKLTEVVTQEQVIIKNEIECGLPPGAPSPPENYMCPVSRRIMYDPVIIASGKTYERVCIEKWFSEGHDTCPETQMKLSSVFTIPNSSLKDLISQWCREHDIILQDPCGRSLLAMGSQISSSNSLNSISASFVLGNRMAHFSFQSNDSNTSTLYDDASWVSYSSQDKHGENSEDVDTHVRRLFTWSVDYQKHQSFSEFNHDSYTRFLSEMSKLPSEDHGKVLEDLNHILSQDDGTCFFMLSNGFLASLTTFLNDSSDMIANKAVVQFLLVFLNHIRDGITPVSEDVVCCLLTCFIDSGRIDLEELMVIRALCSYEACKPLIVGSGVTNLIMEKLDSRDSKLTELAVEILYKLSPLKELVSLVLSSGCLSNLISLLQEKQVSIFSLRILQNLCNTEEGRTELVRSDGLATVAELLEYGSSKEEQAVAVAVLLSLCICSPKYCDVVMKEGVIPSLVDISVNGSDQGKKDSNLLLQLLRNHGTYSTDSSSGEKLAVSTPESSPLVSNVGENPQTQGSAVIVNKQSTKKTPTSKRSRFFGRIFFSSTRNQ